MTSPTSEKTPSCQTCRAKHIKCDGKEPCRNCKKTNRKCVRGTKSFRFRKPPRSKSSLSFSADQTWLDVDKAGSLSYVDVTEQVTRAAKQTSKEKAVPPEAEELLPQNGDPAAGEQHTGDTSMASSSRANSQDAPAEEGLYEHVTIPPPNTAAERISYATANHPVHPDLTSPESMPAPRVSNLLSPHAYSDSALNARPRGNLFSPDMSHHAPSMSTAAATSGTTPFIDTTTLPADPLHGLPEGCTEDSYLGIQEACLMRHFVDNLAKQFESTDRDRHFSLVVPQRAMYSPVLLYAIYTASARHLTRLCHRKDATAVVHFDGIPLPGLDERTAIRYHNVCISYLIAISNDPAQSYNEDALTAATILRFYEQIDTPLTGWDSETYLNIILTVVNTQQDESFYAVRTIHGPLRDTDFYAVPAASMRHSACLIALCQEIWSVFLYRRPFRLPLCPSNDYTNLDPGDDFVWTNRILVWTADVLKFCFGTERASSKNIHQDRFEHWDSLSKFQETWREMQPPSFKPAFFRDSDPSAGRIFPEIWHLNECQLIGLQHYEMGCILLSVYDPRLPASESGVTPYNARWKNAFALQRYDYVDWHCRIRNVRRDW